MKCGGMCAQKGTLTGVIVMFVKKGPLAGVIMLQLWFARSLDSYKVKKMCIRSARFYYPFSTLFSCTEFQLFQD